MLLLLFDYKIFISKKKTENLRNTSALEAVAQFLMAKKHPITLLSEDYDFPFQANDAIAKNHYPALKASKYSCFLIG
jgi:hypothetical protein